MKKRKLYVYDFGLHTYFKEVISHPPEGYEFAVNQDLRRASILKKLRESKLIRFLYKKIVKLIFNPMNILNKVYYKPSPDNTDLILSFSLVNEKKPWIVELIDNPLLFAGYDYSVFIKNLNKIEKSLASPYCKKIIIHTEACRRMFKKYFSPQVVNKIELLPPGISRQEFKRKPKKEINFLFMGSVNNPQDFLIKGGIEALESFKILSKKHSNIRLLFRSQLPQELMSKYQNKNVQFITQKITKSELRELYLESDVLLLPGHVYFIMAFLESMSFGLPIISLDTYGVSDFVINNKNGFTIKPSNKIPYNAPDYPVNIRTKEFADAIRNIDKEVIQRICEKAELMINNKKLREKMSKESLKLARTKFSIEKRKIRLKKIFDEAI